MSDRRLVITDADPNAPDYGKLLALAPNTASSIPIPAFTFGPTKPPVGSLLGEGFYEINTRRGWVWDGAAWLEIAASPVVTYATEALLLADNSKPSGIFAIAANTGAMYAKTSTGWKYVGIKEYATTAQLLGDAPAAGALGIAADDSSLWERTSTGWRCMTIRELADTAAVVAWAGDANCHNGDRAIDLAHDVVYIRTGTGWRPTGYWEDTEANIRAATWPLNGQEAISTDSGRTFVRVNGAWVESPINHYPTQAALLAATPSGSQMAWADDTGNVFTWTPSASAWTGLNTGFDDPVPIGAICDFPSRTIPNGWLECDGSAIPADPKFDALRALLGTANLPGLRGLFSRAAKAGEGLLAKVDWTTGRPKTALTGTTNNTGAHKHEQGYYTTDTRMYAHGHRYTGTSGWVSNNATTSFARDLPYTDTNGNHTHTVTINGGGDAETAPDHARVVRCIKAFHITTVKPAPDQLLTALTAPADGQTLLYDASTSSWKNGPVHAGNTGDLWIVGSIQQSMLTEPQWAAALGTEASKWVLADGRNVAGSKYATVTGKSTIPDLRGAYMRMAGTNGTKANWDGGALDTFQDDNTAMPKNRFTTATDGTHDHGIGNVDLVKTSGNTHNLEPGTGGAPEGRTTFRAGGAHSHTINGGDTETRPKTYSVNYFIKIN